MSSPDVAFDACSHLAFATNYLKVVVVVMSVDSAACVKSCGWW